MVAFFLNQNRDLANGAAGMEHLRGGGGGSQSVKSARKRERRDMNRAQSYAVTYRGQHVLRNERRDRRDFDQSRLLCWGEEQHAHNL